MYTPLMEISSFGGLSLDAQARCLRFLLEALTYANVLYLKAHPSTPSLYAAQPRYVTKPRPYGLEVWQDIAATLKRDSGDCKDFCAWRLAELRLGGEASAEAVFLMREIPKHAPTSGEYVFHVVIRRADGSIEDPTEKLPRG